MAIPRPGVKEMLLALLRSARFPAVMLLIAAAIGLILANSPVSTAVLDIQHAKVGIPGTALEMSLGHWISDGLLAVFFFGVAVELQYELTAGELRSARKAVQPAIAAAGGVLVPIAIYLAIAAPSGDMQGWPVPTATDIAFALGVLAVFGRGLPSALRVFLLALAILDDVVGIIFIAVLYAADVDLALFLLSLLTVAAFGVLSRLLGGRSSAIIGVLMVLIAVLTWALVLASGVHATIAGVMLGLAISQGPGLRSRHALEPWINGAILPVFALSAALVVIPAVQISELSGAFWAILVALPVGKLIGISVFGWVAIRLGKGMPSLAFSDLLAAGALGGIGFTVSLLLSQLSFEGVIADEATLAVLAGSAIALVLSAILVSMRARHHRNLVTTDAAE